MSRSRKTKLIKMGDMTVGQEELNAIQTRALLDEIHRLQLVTWPAQALRVVQGMLATAKRYAEEAEPGGRLAGWTSSTRWQEVVNALDELEGHLSDAVVARPAMVDHLADPFGEGSRS